ncbi:MHYT domain-containing protein [Nocardia sp. NPDC052566]|uniref:MHYT domain-containing protein n=1 Tax=Nocardia sp. NPDC052566 TaxID=3364330 RepID=UPI0037CA7398
MLDIYHFSYGWLTPVLAYTMSVTGSLLGLQCAARGRTAEGRVGWLIGAAVAIGGTGIWVMHFIAMLGFSIRGSDIRYDVPLTLLSAVTAIVVVGIGLFLVNKPEPTVLRLLAGGVITGSGVGAMHYLGMYAMKTSAMITYDAKIVALSMAIAIVAATVALWFTLRVKGFLSILAAALIMGVAVCGMHYTGMASMHAHQMEHATQPGGAGAMELLAPLIVAISVITMLLLISVGLTEIENTMDLPPLKLSAKRSDAHSTSTPEPAPAAQIPLEQPVRTDIPVNAIEASPRRRTRPAPPPRPAMPARRLPTPRPTDEEQAPTTTTAGWPISYAQRPSR